MNSLNPVMETISAVNPSPLKCVALCIAGISLLSGCGSAKDGMFFSAKPPVSVKFRNYDGRFEIEVWNTSDSIIHDVTFSRVVDGEKRSVVVLDIVHPHLYGTLGAPTIAKMMEKLGAIGPGSGVSVTCHDHSSPLSIDKWWDVELSGLDAVKPKKQTVLKWDVDLSGLDAGKPKKQTVLKLTPGLSMSFCYCAPGTFTMGSPLSEAERGDDENQVEVTISRGFWMSQYEVTQDQWVAVMETNPSFTKGGDHPVDGVSWEDAVTFVQRLNALSPEGKKWQFALPTEAQWEYACRAATQTPFSFGSVLTGSAANCNGEQPYGIGVGGRKGDGSAKVGSYSPNPWGLFDMHGNVEEWCSDWYASRLVGGIDPTGPDAGTRRVWRGGSFLVPAAACRSANRPDELYSKVLSGNRLESTDAYLRALAGGALAGEEEPSKELVDSTSTFAGHELPIIGVRLVLVEE